MFAFEVGSHSPWISRLLKELGHWVIVANPRELRAIYQNTRKSDEQDALMLAQIARVDVKFMEKRKWLPAPESFNLQYHRRWYQKLIKLQ